MVNLIQHYLIITLIGVIGGLISYLFTFYTSYIRDESTKFDRVLLIIQSLFGGFSAFLLDPFIVDYFQRYEYSLILVTGYLSISILNFINNNLLDLFLKRYGLEQHDKQQEEKSNSKNDKHKINDTAKQ